MKGTLVKLNSIRMFNMKVVVALAKYDKDHKRISYAPVSRGRNIWRPKESSRKGHNDIGCNVEGGQQPGGIRRMENGHGAKVVNVDGKGSLYPLHCIGRSVEVLPLNKVRLAIEGEGLSDVGLSYLGGMTFLLAFKDRRTASECMEMHSPFFVMLFSKYFLWNGEEIPFSRIVSLNISGVPFLIRDNKLFDNIGGLFGEVVQQSAFSWQEEDNSYGFVKVLTSQMSRIDEVAVIKWNEKSLVIWVSESPELRHPELDMGLAWSSKESESELESDSGEESKDMDDLEEREIKQDMGRDDGIQVGVQNPVTEVEQTMPAPGDNDRAMEDLESPVGQRLIDINVGEQKDDLHGEEDTSACDLQNNGDMVGNPDKYNFSGKAGPNEMNMGNNKSGSGHDLFSDGPTPMVNLGKRNRDDQSPSSIGSIQGPTQRLFYQPNNSDYLPMDLNTPVREESVTGEDKPMNMSLKMVRR
ncbi:hypothetical protein Hanom_Chr16g01485671 [Helianthus anomalus]